MATRSSAVIQNVQRSTNRGRKDSFLANQQLPAHSEMSPKEFKVLPPVHILQAIACVKKAADDSDVHTYTVLSQGST